MSEDFFQEMEEEFSKTKSVIRDEIRFKIKLALDDNVFRKLKLAQDGIESLGVGAITAGAFGAYWLNTISVLERAVLGGATFLGKASVVLSTQIGWFLGAGVIAATATHGLKKLRKKIDEKSVYKAPKFLSSPLDTVAINVAELLMNPAIRIACAGGNFGSEEKQSIRDYFVEEWGYDPDFTDDLIHATERRISSFNYKEYRELLYNVCKQYSDVGYDKFIKELMTLLNRVACAGSSNLDKQRELDVFQLLFESPPKREGFISKAVTGIMRRLKSIFQGKTSKSEAVPELVSQVVNAATKYSIESSMLAGKTDVIQDIRKRAACLIANRFDIVSGNSDLSPPNLYEEIAGILESSKQTAASPDIKAENPLLDTASQIGKTVGKASGILSGDEVGQKIGELVVRTGEYLNKSFGIQCSPVELMEQTEFSSENLEFLYEFGVTQEKMTLLMEAFARKCNELDGQFMTLVKEDKEVTDDMMKAITDI